MGIWDVLSSFWSDHGDASVAPIWFVPLVGDQITDDELRSRSGVVAEAGTHYVEFTVRRMNLATDELVTRKRHPVIHSQIKFDTTGGSVITIPAIAGESTVDGLKLAAGNKASLGSLPLTSAIPYVDGRVELVAGVLSMKGEALLDRLTQVVTQVTTLVPAAIAAGTAVQTGIGFANAALDGVETLFGATDTSVVLGVHQLLSPTSGAPLRSGLYAVVNPRTTEASGNDLVDPDLLVYDDEELGYRTDGRIIQLRAQDWIVIEIALDDHRAYDSYPDLVEKLDLAIQAVDRSIPDATALLNSAVISARTSSQIVRKDRAAVVAEMKAEFDAAVASLAPVTRGAVEVAKATTAIPRGGAAGILDELPAGALAELVS